jgi:hypothetical protein
MQTFSDTTSTSELSAAFKAKNMPYKYSALLGKYLAYSARGWALLV